MAFAVAFFCPAGIKLHPRQGGQSRPCFLKQLGIRVCAYTKSIGPVACESFCQEEISRNPLCMPDADASLRAQDYLEECMKQQDSCGGVVECFADGVPAGLGDPVFDKLDAALAGAVMSIGAVKAVEIGDGIAVSQAKGSENNDPFHMCGGRVEKETNHAGGILGGISDGSRILLRAHIKPTPSIFSEQQTVTRDGENITIRIKGRHDPVIVPRAVVVVEAMTSLVLADALLSNMTARLDRIRDFYGV